MPSINSDKENPAEHEKPTMEMTKYGITNKPADCFYYGEYKYTNLPDAIAQAKRDILNGTEANTELSDD